MINKPLLTGIIGFILGGLLVSIVATAEGYIGPEQRDVANCRSETATH